MNIKRAIFLLALPLLISVFAPYAAGHEIVGWGNNTYGKATL